MQHWLDLSNQMLILLVYAASLNVLLGYGGQASVAHAAFGGIGGYAAAYAAVHSGLSFLPGIFLAAGLAFVAGCIVSVTALKMTWDYLVLGTLAIASMFGIFVVGAPWFGGAYGLLGVEPGGVFGHDLLQPSDWTPVLVVVGAIAFGICWRLGESPFGRVLKGVREDEDSVRSLGKNIVRFKVVLFGLTAALAGVAGACSVYYNQIASPSQFTFNQSVLLVAMVILGGAGNLVGTIIGVVAIFLSGPLLESAVDLDAEKASLVRLMIYGFALVLVIRFRPTGLFPERRMKRLPRWMARTAGPSERVSLESLVQSNALSAGANTPTLAATGVSKHFGGLAAVDQVDIELLPGGITGLIGPNGAGKTTLFSCLTGLLRCDTGAITLGGVEIRGEPSNVIARRGLVRSFQDVRLIQHLTALENVALAVPKHPGESVTNLFFRPRRVRAAERGALLQAQACLDFVGLGEKAFIPVRDLAYGEQKLVAIARILATNAPILLLDEPTSGVDPVWVGRVADTIRSLPSLGKTVCIVEHNLGFMKELGASCYFMMSGKVVAAGTVDTLMGEPDLRRLYFGR
jgi:branched-chain amino acid transport system permease protein